MNLTDLNKVAPRPGRAGQGHPSPPTKSTGTIKKRFDAINVASTEEVAPRLSRNAVPLPATR